MFSIAKDRLIKTRFEHLSVTTFMLLLIFTFEAQCNNFNSTGVLTYVSLTDDLALDNCKVPTAWCGAILFIRLKGELIDQWSHPVSFSNAVEKLSETRNVLFGTVPISNDNDDDSVAYSFTQASSYSAAYQEFNSMAVSEYKSNLKRLTNYKSTYRDCKFVFSDWAPNGSIKSIIPIPATWVEKDWPAG